MPENKKYTLDELVGGCDPSRPLDTEEETWLEAPPVGQEIGSDQDDEPAPSRNPVGKPED